MPIDSRYSSGSNSPVTNASHMRRYASVLRSTTRSAPDAPGATASRLLDRDRRDHVVNALVKRRTPHQHPAARHTTRNATCPTHRTGRRRRPGGGGAAQLDRVPQRREPRHRLQPVGQPADREERAREQEQREQPDAHDDGERDVALLRDRVAVERGGEHRRAAAPRPGSRARPTATARRRGWPRRSGTPSPT